jgi:hypothetical protein
VASFLVPSHQNPICISLIPHTDLDVENIIILKTNLKKIEHYDMEYILLVQDIDELQAHVNNITILRYAQKEMGTFFS